jgi:multidrug efflux pump subunit AcrA (membrane-fusion protein)
MVSPAQSPVLPPPRSAALAGLDAQVSAHHRVPGRLPVPTQERHSAERSPISLLSADSLYRMSQGAGKASPATLLPLLAHASGAAAVYLIRFETQPKTTCLKRDAHGRAEVVSGMGPEIERLTHRAVADSQAAWSFVRCEAGKFLGVVVPVVTGPNQVSVLAAAFSEQRPSEGPSLAGLLQGYGTWLIHTAAMEGHQREGEALGRVSALVELIRLCSAAEDLPEASGLMADHLREVIGCQTVALVGYRRGRPTLLAASGGLDLAQRSEGSGLLESCISEATRRKEMFTRTPGQSVETSFAPGVIEQTGRLLQADGWVVAPLSDADGTVGGWSFWWSQPDPRFAEKVRFLKASGAQISPFIRLLQQGKARGYSAVLRRIWRRLKRTQRGAFILGAGFLLVVGGFPMPERIAADCQAEPMVRRIVAAPFSATLRETVVEAGDLVEVGTLLAELDGREIRFALADAVANRARASKEADQALEAGQVAEAQMASLEAETYQQSQELNETRQQQLEIRSPIAGLVLAGDLERAEGAPLQVGDRLFEIAPLDRLLVEIDLEESEISRVQEGQSVQIRFDAYPGENFPAVVERVPPRSEVRANRNVFVCETSLNNPEGRLRPGMKGRARIEAKAQPLVWPWLRPAINYLRLRLWL